MAFYTVLVNGVPQSVGSTSAPLQTSAGVAVTSSGGPVAVYNLGTPGAANYERAVLQFNANFAEIGTESAGSGQNRSLRLKSSGGILVNVTGSDRWFYDSSAALRPASSAASPDLGSSNVPVGNVWLAPTKRLDFGQTASTFAQTATITNGPRAANPVAWVEVSYNAGASTGRIPIW